MDEEDKGAISTFMEEGNAIIEFETEGTVYHLKANVINLKKEEGLFGVYYCLHKKICDLPFYFYEKKTDLLPWPINNLREIWDELVKYGFHRSK